MKGAKNPFMFFLKNYTTKKITLYIMIYINNEIYKLSPKEKDNFNKTFESYLDEKGGLVKPVKIKYIPSLIKKDKDNPGKIKMPRSKSLSFVVQTMHDGQQVELRYSSTPARVVAKTGELQFSNTSISVFDGELNTTDKDLIWFFWNHSEQNAGNSKNMDKHNAWFIIEDKEAENREIARLKKVDATIKARLWNDVADGGLSDNEIIKAAKHGMIPGIDKMDDVNEIRTLLEKVLEINKPFKEEFLTMTDVRNKKNDDFIERKYLIQSAIDLGIIGMNSINKSFYLLDEKGKQNGSPLMKWTAKIKDPKVALYMQLEQTNKDLLDVIQDKVNAKREHSSFDSEE
jgi:hypothetical protein